MSFGTRVLTGRVVRDSDGEGLRGVQVRLVLASSGRTRTHDTNVSGSAGSFRLRLPERNTRGQISLTFEVDGAAVRCQTPTKFPTTALPEPGLEYRVLVPVGARRAVDATPSEPVDPGSVRGVVTHANGTAVAGATVRLYQRDVGAITLLDSATTGSDGEYTLTYTYSAPPDLFVVVLDGDDNIVRRSRPMFDAAEHEIANIQVKSAALAGPTEFARLDAVLAGALTGVDPETIGVDDTPYLAQRFGLPAESVRAYLKAAKVAPSVSISAEALFALLLAGGPSTAKSLTSLDPATVTRMLERAAAKGLVSTTIGTDAADIADDLLGDLVSVVAAGTAPNNMGGLLTHVAGLSNAKRDAVLGEVMTNHRKGEALFDAIALLPDFTSGDVDAVRRASTLSAVCLGHVPLVRAFDTTYTTPVAYTAAGLTLANWRSLLDATVGGVDVDTPDWVDGATESDRRDAFAALVFRRAGHQFPSHRVASGFRAADPGDTTDLSKFVRDNPLVDLRKTNLTTFFETADLSAVGDAPALLDRVRKIQRLLRIAPPDDQLAVVQALESAGYGSAGAVARRSRESFVNRHAAEIGEAKAKAVHARARKTVTRTQMYDLRTRYQEPIGIDEEQLPKSMYTEEPESGSYMTLFGLPSCGCTSCQSVTSMSAYLVDVLHWLDSQDSDGDGTLYELLVERRPDIAEVKLICSNSDTAMPQVDLAIEVFEAAVVGEGAVVPERTSLTTDELLAMPEHENGDAYEILNDAAWPFVLPYDHALRQQQVAFAHLGVDTDELLDLFPTAAPTAVEVNALALGGSVSWGTLVTTEVPDDAWTWWGFDGETGPHPHPDETGDTVAWYVALRYVPELLARLDLPDPSEDLLDLLHARYIQGESNVVELVTATAGSCDFAHYYVGEVYDGTPQSTPSAVTFTRMATFVRLQRVLGWSYLDLDTVLVAWNLLGSDTETNIDATALAKLADLVRVRTLRPKIGLDELAAWFSGSLPTRLDRETKEEPRPPLYDRLFLDPSVVKPGSSPFKLNGDRTELNSPGGALLPTHESTLLGALQTNQVDLQDAVALAAVVLGHAVEKDLQDLTCLHAIVSSARHSGMTVRTMRRLSTAVGNPPYHSPAAAVTWFRHLDVWADSGLTPDALAWVLSLEPTATAALGPTEDSARSFLGGLRDRLRALAGEASAGTTLVDRETVRTDVSLFVADPATVTAVLDAVATAESSGDLDPVRDALGDWLPALAPLLTFTLPDEIGKRWGWVHEKLSASLLLVRQKDAIHTAVADQWGLSTVVAAAICEVEIATHSKSVDETLTHEDFLTADDEDPASPWADLLPSEDVDAFEVVSWLARVAHLVQTWTLDDTFVQRWVADAGRIGLLDLGTLPVTDSVSSLAAKYAALYATWRLRSASADPAWSTSLSALASGQVSGFADQLVAGHGWVRETIDASLVERDLGTVTFTSAVDLTDSEDDVVVTLAGVVVTASPSPDWASTSEALLALKDEIAGTGALDAVVVAVCLNASGAVTTGGTPAVSLRVALHASQTVVHDLTSPSLVATPVLYVPETLWRAVRRLTLCAEHGVSDAEMTSWALTAPDLNDAAKVRLAVRAKYDDPKRWSAVWRPVRDQVRRSQQAALLAWLRTNDATATTNDELYAKYLIDGEMDPINLTTRIQQAIASTQLFVQRVGLGLEAGCSLDEENAERWEWMRSWRVWEAARKVWLYPENWIEPELRVEKSELFEAFEQDLLSGDLTNAAAEKALVRYIRQLQHVANPAIAGMCSFAVDAEDGSADVRTVHVFAQTRHTPLRTFFRTFVEQARWTPWSEVKVGVTGKSLCPVVFKGRLLLFWHDLTELEGEKKNGGVDKYVRVKVCWSEYVDGVWSERRETGEISTEHDDYGTVQENRWSVRAISENGVLRIDLLQVAKVRWEDGEIVTDDDLHEVIEKCWEFNPLSGNLVKGDLETPVRWSLRALDSSIRNSGYRIPASPLYANSSLTEDTGDETEPTIDRLYMPFSKGKDSTDTNAMYAICLFPYQTAMHVTPPRNGTVFDTDNPFVVYDAERAYLLDITLRDATFNKHVTSNGVVRRDEDLGDATFVAYTMHHPYVGAMLERISKAGVSGLLASLPNTALRYQATNDLDEEGLSTFERYYQTNNIVKGDAERMPLDEFDFGFTSAMGVYNWEIFFHSVTLVAERMRQNGRYEDALRWLHYVYDPRKKPDHRWRIKPLRELDMVAVDKWTAGLADEGTADIDVTAYEAWLDNPFDPHIVAMGRPSAYQRFTIKRYVEVVLDWADSRFATDGREAINEAAQLYLYARDILGPAAPKPPQTTLAVERSFSSMRTSLDTFSNRAVQLENAVPTVAWMQVKAKEPGPLPFESVTFEYFCTPPSEVVELLRGRIDDRLFKIRHSMNIDGVVRTLPIFEPAIDPAALVRAAAAGASLGSVLNTSSGPPLYRFMTSLARAKELAGVASALGNALLSQLEKRDGERLSNLRERQDLRMQQLTKDVRELQVEEAEAAVTAAQAARVSVAKRYNYYNGLLESLPLDSEIGADAAFGVSTALNLVSGLTASAAAVAAMFPEVTIKLGSPETTFGGQNLNGTQVALASSLALGSSSASLLQRMLEQSSSRKLRKQDWEQQVATAEAELGHHDELIAAAKLRVKVAKDELRNHERQIKHVEARIDFLSRKFTNTELYGWMIGTTSQIHSQTYQMALEVARQAEAAYRYELGITSASFVSYANWDSLRKGALAGERLAFDLARMERAYLDNDRRELQITKHVSLAQLDPVALQQLKDNRSCFFRVPEVLFDLDFPGHYFRRLKGVTVSVPCVAGPYVGINATLSLQQTHTRIATNLVEDTYAYDPADPDDRVRVDTSVESIAISGAQDESGVFNFDFNNGPRYVPFERRGVIGHWQLELTSPYPSFDPQSIGDVVLTLRYTARDGGVPFREAVMEELPTLVANYDGEAANVGKGFRRALSARHDFPDAWHALLNPADEGATDLLLSFDLTPEHFPVGMRTPGLTVVQVEVAMVRKTGAAVTLGDTDVTLVFGSFDDPLTLDDASPGFGVLYASTPVEEAVTAPVEVEVSMSLAEAVLSGFGSGSPTRLDPTKLEDIVFVVHYVLAPLP